MYAAVACKEKSDGKLKRRRNGNVKPKRKKQRRQIIEQTKHKENLWNSKVGLTSENAGVLLEICYSHWGYVVTSCVRHKEAKTKKKEASLQNAAVQHADKLHLDGPFVSNEKRMRSLVLQQCWAIFVPLVSTGFVRAQRAACQDTRIHVTRKDPFLDSWNLTAALIY